MTSSQRPDVRFWGKLASYALLGALAAILAVAPAQARPKYEVSGDARILYETIGSRTTVIPASPGKGWEYDGYGEPYQVASISLVGCTQCGANYLSYDNSGNLEVAIVSGSITALLPFAGNADAQTATASGQASGEAVFNGTTWDRAYEGNQLGAQLVSVGAWLSDGCTTGCANAISNGTVTFKTGAGIYYGSQDVTSANQNGTLNCYDNASAASGKKIDSQLLAAGQAVIIAGTAGKAFSNGLTCNLSAAAVGDGVEVYFR